MLGWNSSEDSQRHDYWSNQGGIIGLNLGGRKNAQKAERGSSLWTKNDKIEAVKTMEGGGRRSRTFEMARTRGVRAAGKQKKREG